MNRHHAASLACERCGEPALMRVIEDAIDGYWTKIRLPLCAPCDESLRFCDLRAWNWFRKYTLNNSN